MCRPGTSTGRQDTAARAREVADLVSVVQDIADAVSEISFLVIVIVTSIHQRSLVNELIHCGSGGLIERLIEHVKATTV